MNTDWVPEQIEVLEKGCWRLAILFTIIGISIGIGIAVLIYYLWMS